MKFFVSIFDLFEYGGIWIHATDKYSQEWRKKVGRLIPPIEQFHRQFIIFSHLGLEAMMSEGLIKP
jgi:hypothetical protein